MTEWGDTQVDRQAHPQRLCLIGEALCISRFHYVESHPGCWPESGWPNADDHKNVDLAAAPSRKNAHATTLHSDWCLLGLFYCQSRMRNFSFAENLNPGSFNTV